MQFLTNALAFTLENETRLPGFTPLTQGTFSAAPLVAEPSAGCGGAAFGRATAGVLDALTRWVEATVAAQPAR